MDLAMLRTCNLCGHASFEKTAGKLRDNISTHKIYKCKSCGHIQLLPRLPLMNFSKKTLEKDLKSAGSKKIDVKHIQRYDIENLCNWLITGKPQIEKLVFEIDGSYKWLEDYYRNYLENIERTDALVAMAYKN